MKQTVLEFSVHRSRRPGARASPLRRRGNTRDIRFISLLYVEVSVQTFSLRETPGFIKWRGRV